MRARGGSAIRAQNHDDEREFVTEVNPNLIAPDTYQCPRCRTIWTSGYTAHAREQVAATGFCNPYCRGLAAAAAQKKTSRVWKLALVALLFIFAFVMLFIHPMPTLATLVAAVVW